MASSKVVLIHVIRWICTSVVSFHFRSPNEPESSTNVWWSFEVVTYSCVRILLQQWTLRSWYVVQCAKELYKITFTWNVFLITNEKSTSLLPAPQAIDLPFELDDGRVFLSLVILHCYFCSYNALEMRHIWCWNIPYRFIESPFRNKFLWECSFKNPLVFLSIRPPTTKWTSPSEVTALRHSKLVGDHPDVLLVPLALLAASWTL